MRNLYRLSIHAVCLLSLALQASALSEKSRLRVEAATVRVVYEHPDFPLITTGVLLQRNGANGVVATCNISTPFVDALEDVYSVLLSTSSGDLKAKAEIVGWDRQTGVVILRVRGDELPEPVVMGSLRDVPTEGQELYLASHPLLVDAASNRLDKAVIGRVTIGAVVRDRAGRVVLSHGDTSWLKTQLGAPVVDDTGSLVGVATPLASDLGTSGTILPLGEIIEMLAGRTSKLTPSTDGWGDSTGVTFRVRVDLVDPFRRIAGLSLRYCYLEDDVEEYEPPRSASGDPLPLPEPAFTSEIKRDGDIATAQGFLPGASRKNRILYQVIAQRKDGTTFVSLPRIVATTYVARHRDSSQVDAPPPVLPGGVVKEISESCVESVQRLGPYEWSRIQFSAPWPDSCFAWSAKPGHGFFVTREPLQIRRVSLPNLVVDRVVDFGPTSGVARIFQTEAGLALHLGMHREIIVYGDPDLEELHRISLPTDCSELLTSPRTPIAVAVDTWNDVFYMIDLKEGRLLGKQLLKEIPAPSNGTNARHRVRSGFAGALMSDDGKYVYLAKEGIHQFAVTREGLRYRAIQPEVDGTISLQRDMVIVTPLAGKALPLHPLPPDGGSYVFHHDDLSKPVRTLGFASGIFHVNQEKGRILNMTRDRFFVRNMSGVQLEEFELHAGPASDFVSFLADPTGEWLAHQSVAGLTLILDQQPPTAADAGPTQPHVRGDTVTQPGLRLTRVDVPVGDAFPRMLWRDGGRSFYLLDAGSTLWEVSSSGLFVLNKRTVGDILSDLADSSEGLVATDRGANKLFLIDRSSFRILGTAPIPGYPLRVVGSPASSTAFVITDEGPIYPCDLKSMTFGEPIEAAALEARFEASLRKHPSSREFSGWSEAAMSPDGKLLFFMCGDSLHRCRVVGQELFYEEAGPPIRGTSIVISPDNRYVVALDGYGNDAQPEWDKPGTDTTFIFSVNDLQTPVTHLTLDDRITALSFDLARKSILATVPSRLINVDAHGITNATWSSMASEGWDQLLLSEDGRLGLLRSSGTLQFLEFDR